MSFNSALSAGNLTSLRGDGTTPPRYHAAQFLSLCPNTTVFACRVNQSSFAASFAQVTYDTVTVGAFGDVQVGQTVYISHTNDIRAAHFVGRIRAAPTSTILNINETSAAVTDDDYIFVIHDFRVWDKLAREVSNVQRKDYDITFRQIPPVIYGLKSAYVGIVSGSPTGLTVSFAAQAFAGTSGATISSYAYTITTGMTVTAGSASTANVTIRFDAGFYWLKLVVTDSGSRTATRYIPVWSVPSDLSSQVALGFTGSQISGDLSTGFNATIEAFDGISSVYDNTLCVIWDVEYYNGTAENIIGNVRCVGRLRNETDTGQSDESYSYLTSTQFEIEGAGSQLSRITAPLLALRYDTTPTVWDEITNLTIWRAIVHLLHEHSTFLTLHSLEFSSTANTFLAKILNTQGGNLLAAVQDLAQAINATMQFAYDGRSEVVRDLRYESTANRNAAVTVVPYTTQDLQDLRLAIDHIETIGKSEAAGGTFNATSGAVVPLLAIAPGVAQGMGEGRNPLQRQILTANVTKSTAQSELNTRVGHHFALSNPTDILTITHPDGYHWLIPAVNQWYTWTLTTATNLRGRAYTTSNRWLLTQVSISHDNETGTKTVEATYSLETEGVAGQTVTYPPPATIPTPISVIPPFDAYTSFPELPDNYISDPTYPPVFQGNPSLPPAVAPDNGNTVMIWTATQLWISTNFISTSTPLWNEITPTLGGSDSIIAAAFSGFVDHAAYVLVNTTSTSIVYYTSDVFASEVDWTAGDEASGLFKLLRLTNTANNLFLYGSNNDITQYLTSADGAVWNSGNGNNTGITINSGETVVIDATGTWCNVHPSSCFGPEGTGTPPGAGFMAPSLSGASLLYRLGTSGAWSLASTHVEFVAGSTNTLYLIMNDANSALGFSDNSGTLTVLVTVYGTGAANAIVLYSNDSGVTYAAPIIVGTSPGAYGGFDTVKLGAQSLAAKDTRAAIATTLGGAYANYGNVIPTSGDPSCIVVPRYKPATATTNNSNTATPEYIVASNVSSGNQYVNKVTASGVTFTDITFQISSDFGKAVSANCLAMAWKSGNRIAAILVYNTTRHLIVSTNGGTSWTDRGALSSAADFITYRKGDGLLNQLFFVDGSVGPKYSGNHGAVIGTKSYPSTDALVGIAVFG